MTGYTPSSISQLETGAQGYEEATLVKLAQALECKPGDLISGPPDEIAFINELRALDSGERSKVISALNDMLTHIRKLSKRD
jgi:transcriptional regulator with XRE-family HTH domain